MVTRSIKKTPFGYRVSYLLNGEDHWTEYITIGNPSESDGGASQRRPLWTWVARMRSSFVRKLAG